MKRHLQQHPLEIRLAKIANGFRSIEDRTYGLVFGEGKLLPDEIVKRMQKGLDAFAKARHLEAEVELARQARDGQLTELKRLCDEAVVVAKRHYGGDAEKMATFGVDRVTASKPRVARPEARRRCCVEPSRCGETVKEVVTTVVEEVTTLSEKASCESQAPNCEEGTRKPRCRGSRLPKRTAKPKCEGAKGCGSRVSRGVK